MSDTIAVSAQRSIQQQRNQVIATPKCGGRGQLGLASATLYTVPTVANAPVSHPKAILKSIVLCNTDSSARTVTIYLIESGGAVAADRAILSAASVAAGETWVVDFGDGIALETAETIRGLASVASKVTYRISVVELT
jgi:hypothetical protein